MSSLECVADAIMHYEGWALGSCSYRNRNPGNLRAAEHSLGDDANGYAIFPSLIDGYSALLEDLAAKFTGKTRSGLGPASTLAELFAIYAPSADHNAPEKYAAFVAHWLTVGLQRVVLTSTALHEIWSPDPPEPAPCDPRRIAPVGTDPEKGL